MNNITSEGPMVLRDVPRGEFVKLNKGGKKVYRKGDYDRSSRKYTLLDCDDISNARFVYADKIVFVGFTY